jgi:arginine decarboxylase
MTTVRVAAGTGTGPTELAAYDAALAAIDLHDYNLRHVSSIIPQAASVEVVDRLPDLGPAGGGITVVEAKAVAAGPAQVAAALGWTRSPEGAGVFYEAAGEADVETLRDRIDRGLRAATELRDRSFGVEGAQHVETANTSADDGHVAAVVVGVYGSAESVG